MLNEQQFYLWPNPNHSNRKSAIQRYFPLPMVSVLCLNDRPKWARFFKWAHLGLFLFVFDLFKHKLYRKSVGVRGIRTRILRIEGEHADHLTTTTAQARILCKQVENYLIVLARRRKSFMSGKGFYCRQPVNLNLDYLEAAQTVLSIAPWFRLRLPSSWGPGSNPSLLFKKQLIL